MRDGWSMTGTDAARLIRGHDTPKRATLLELLFDLIYVAAFALLSIRLADNITWRGVGHTLVLLMAIWWTWSITTLLTDYYNPEQAPIQAIVTITMLGAVLMTIAVPSAFAAHAALFAGAYVGIHIVRGVLLLTALRGHQVQARAARFLFWFGLSGILWIAGAFVGSPGRAILWASALAVDLLAAAIRYPTPRYGRVPLEQYDRTNEHLAERYQQMMILALGELVLVPSLTLSRIGFDLARVVAFLVAFAMTLLLWQLYAHSGGVISVLVSRRSPGRGPRLAPYTHFLMAAGVVATAAGSKLVITRPTGHTPVGWICVVNGGPALYLAGRTIFEYAFVGRLSRTRAGWLAVLIVAAPPMAFVPPVFASVVAGGVLAGVAGTDHLGTSGKLPRWLAPAAREE
jgi:low temperature requirement protein LtrA